MQLGRSPKVGLDYFRLDVNLDDKFELIEAEFGLTGFAVVVRLYQRIYGGAGYYCEWDDEVALVFGSRNKLGANVVSEIVKAAIKRKLFDQNLFDRYRILTSTGIQKWYFEAVSRREQVEVIREYLLIPVDILPKNVNINSISADINAISADRNAHSRAEHSTGKDSKGEDSRGDSGGSIPDNPFSDAAGHRPGFSTLEVYASSNLRNMTAYNAEELASFKGDLPDDLIRYAIDEACGNGHPVYSYVRSILNRYIEDGIRTVGDAKAADRQRRKKGDRNGANRRSPDQGAGYQQYFDGETVV